MTTHVNRLREELEAKRQIVQHGLANGAVKIEGENLSIKSEDVVTLRKALADAEDIETLINAELFEKKSGEFLEYLNQPADEPHLNVAARNYGRKSMGQLLVESKEFKGLNRASSLELNVQFDGLGNITERKDVYSALPSTTASPFGFGQIEHAPLVERPQRPVRVRDLFPVANTTAAAIQYIRTLDPEFNAAAIAQRNAGNTDFVPSPKSKLKFQSETAQVRLLSHWVPVHRDTLDDEPSLAAVIDNELLFGLSLEEDRQILAGSGTGDELLGLLNTSGIQTYVPTVDDSPADVIRKQKTLCALAYLPATGVILHPDRWEDIELTKAKPNGDGQYVVVTNVALGAQQQVWRCPVVDTPAISASKVLVGAFGVAAQLYDRRQAAVRISEHFLFDKNAIAVMADERLALTVSRPLGLAVADYSLTSEPVEL